MGGGVEKDIRWILDAGNVPLLLFPDLPHFLPKEVYPKAVIDYKQREKQSLDHLHCLVSTSIMPGQLIGGYSLPHSLLCWVRRSGCNQLFFLCFQKGLEVTLIPLKDASGKMRHEGAIERVRLHRDTPEPSSS